MKYYTIKVNGLGVVMVGDQVTLQESSCFSLWQPTRWTDAAQGLRVLAAQWRSVGTIVPVSITVEETR